MRETLYCSVGKRCFDTGLAFFALILLLPLFLITAIAIKLSSRGPVFFRQMRVGRYGRPFNILKFRTMRPSGEARGSLLTAAGDPRVTTVGQWLRKTKIDELPQLMNVIYGDMSLVGPRPEVPEYAASYTERQRQILSAKPGITGPAANTYIDEEQLLANQPDKEAFYLNTVLPAKLEYDIAYCERVQFRTDLFIIWQTTAKVCSKFIKLAKPSVPAQENQS